MRVLGGCLGVDQGSWQDTTLDRCRTIGRFSGQARPCPNLIFVRVQNITPLLADERKGLRAHTVGKFRANVALMRL